MIHGDVKPANLRIGPGQKSVLVDFGVAALSGGGHTGAALDIGPNPYAPMELCYEDSELRGPWTDVYGLAGAFHTVVTGRTPALALDRSHAVLQGAPDPLEPAVRVAAGAYPAELLQAIDHGLGFTPPQRPLSVAAYREELVRATCGENQAKLPLAPIYRDPPGRPDSHVEATWILKRNGRSLGQPGATTAFARAGIGLLSTALTLPVGTAPRRYTVEHRIETENGRDSASSQFSVVSR